MPSQVSTPPPANSAPVWASQLAVFAGEGDAGVAGGAGGDFVFDELERAAGVGAAVGVEFEGLAEVAGLVGFAEEEERGFERAAGGDGDGAVGEGLGEAAGFPVVGDFLGEGVGAFFADEEAGVDEAGGDGSGRARRGRCSGRRRCRRRC
jgi:hypothetical protein